MRKLFRHHRGGLQESLSTVVEVNDFADIERIIANEWGDYCSNLNTQYCTNDSRRLSEEWKATYYVLADFKDGHKQQCIGFCNFHHCKDFNPND